jgi:hypothetical protein
MSVVKFNIRRKQSDFRKNQTLSRCNVAASENAKGIERVNVVVWAVLFLWLLSAFILGANEAFVRDPGAPPLPILAGMLTPLIVFFAAYRFSGSFRGFVMSIDPQLAAGIQAWRFAGMGFIALYAYGVLPGLFAWPAGLGDMAIGATAPWIILALRDRKDFLSSRLFLVWNLLGILDLVSAVSLGAISSVLGLGISGEITTFPMARLPLVLIPVFLVPLFLMLHLSSLFQAGCVAADGKTYRWACPPTRRGPAQTPA